MLAHASIDSMNGASKISAQCLSMSLDKIRGKYLPSRRLQTSCPAIQAPPKKALLSREQFEDGILKDRDGQVPMY